MVLLKSVLERIKNFQSIYEANNAIMHDFFKHFSKNLIIARLVYSHVGSASNDFRQFVCH